MKRVFLLLPIIALLALGCGQEPDTPEKAIAEIKQAIENYDYDRFYMRVDKKSLLDAAYDDASVELALQASIFKARYPDDPFFQNDPEFIVNYNDLNRADHMTFINAVVDKCFERELAAPTNFGDNVIDATAAELRNYYTTSRSILRTLGSDDKKAFVRVNATFESLYAGGLHQLPLELEFEMQGDRWRLTKIKNVGETLDTLVDIAEKLWPQPLNH